MRATRPTQLAVWPAPYPPTEEEGQQQHQQSSRLAGSSLVGRPRDSVPSWPLLHAFDGGMLRATMKNFGLAGSEAHALRRGFSVLASVGGQVRGRERETHTHKGARGEADEAEEPEKKSVCFCACAVYVHRDGGGGGGGG